MVASLIWRGHRFNQRTIDMLTTVERSTGQALYITQGSYNPGGVEQSFGTHDGGGVVDLWPVNGIDVAEGVVAAMRAVGFAAWIRDPSQGDWGYHIHGVAIDDPDLSQPAQVQIVEYLGGNDGLGGPDYHPRPNPIKTFEQFSGTVLPPSDVNGGRRIAIPEALWVDYDGTGTYPWLGALGTNYIPQEINESVPLITSTTPGGPVAFVPNDPRGTYVVWRFEPGAGEYLIDNRLNRLFDGHLERNGEWSQLFIYKQSLTGGAITHVATANGSTDLVTQDGFRYYIVVGGVSVNPQNVTVGGGLWGVLRVTDKLAQIKGWFRENDREVLIADAASTFVPNTPPYATLAAVGSVSSFGFRFDATIYRAFGGPQPGTLAQAGQWAWDIARRGGKEGFYTYNHTWEGPTNENPYQPPTSPPPAPPYAINPQPDSTSVRLKHDYFGSNQVGYQFIYDNQASQTLHNLTVQTWIAEKQFSAESVAQKIGYRAMKAKGGNDDDYTDLYAAQSTSNLEYYVEFEDKNVNVIQAWVRPDKQSGTTQTPTLGVNWYLVAPVQAEFADSEIWGPHISGAGGTWRFGGRGNTQISNMFGRATGLASDWLEFSFSAARQYETNNPSVGGSMRFLGVPSGFEDAALPPGIQGYGVQDIDSSEIMYSDKATLAYKALVRPPRYRLVPHVFEPAPYSPTYLLPSEEGGEVEVVDGPDSDIDGRFETSRARFT